MWLFKLASCQIGTSLHAEGFRRNSRLHLLLLCWVQLARQLRNTAPVIKKQHMWINSLVSYTPVNHAVCNLLVECKEALLFSSWQYGHSHCICLSCCWVSVFPNGLSLAVVYLVLFHLSFIMFVWSYWMTIFTRPANPSKEVNGSQASALHGYCLCETVRWVMLKSVVFDRVLD